MALDSTTELLKAASSNVLRFKLDTELPAALAAKARVTGRIVQFPGFAEFAVTPRDIVCHPRTGVPLATVRHLLLDQLIPALLASRARLVLHASAVDIGARAVGSS